MALLTVKWQGTIHPLAFIYVVVKNPLGAKSRRLIVLHTGLLHALSILQPISVMCIYRCVCVHTVLNLIDGKNDGTHTLLHVPYMSKLDIERRL